MRGLKILVVIMGVLLVGGFAALVSVIAERVSHRAPEAVAALPFTAPPIELPKGARIETVSTGPDRIVVSAILEDGARELVIIDMATGRQLGTIPLREGK
jgi:hypothetical protein